MRYRTLTPLEGNLGAGAADLADVTYLSQNQFQGQVEIRNWAGVPGLTLNKHLISTIPIAYNPNGFMTGHQGGSVGGRSEYIFTLNREVILKAISLPDFDNINQQNLGERLTPRVPRYPYSPVNTNVSGMILEGQPFSLTYFGMRGPWFRSVVDRSPAPNWHTWGGPGNVTRAGGPLPAGQPVPELPEAERRTHTIQYNYGQPQSIGSGHTGIQFDLVGYGTAYCDLCEGTDPLVWRDSVTSAVLTNPNFVEPLEA